ncbi:MAPEG family protein [Achromobacter sp. GG226]|uniref:MAPEG family protein n=1 Tax=Verticiella alkaliphila TaxID=2779529 RepID=UPI001C0BC71F|nr:MAPEG family protein [Verticiella sp. GG226]MBU4612549.1 MAPEG family protein [Verticiella sp. GG226]
MTQVTWLLLAAAFLPLLSAVAAKAGGDRFDNETPRTWLSKQEGWRARANAAQQNAFEALPFFYAAALFALHQGADPGRLGTLMGFWLLARIAYLGCYIAGRGLLRSLVWVIALALNITILFSGN